MNRPHDRFVRSNFAFSLALVLAGLAAGCATTGTHRGGSAAVTAPAAVPTATPAGAPASAAAADSKVGFTLLQINDVYEITPVAGGKSGGLARVATLRKRLLAKNPNTFTVLAGDFISPSALGTAKVDGERLSGKQMVAVLNALGLDVTTFGNHEFDYDQKTMVARIAESKFRWISANVADADGRPFLGVAPDAVFTVAGPGGREIKVALIGVTITEAHVPWVTYTEPLAAMRERLQALGDDVDVRIGLTHLAFAEDVDIVEQLPGLDLVLGGHEHENIEARRGTAFTPIYKADANARSVWIHDLAYDPASDRLEVHSQFVPVTDEIPDDPEVAAVVNDWVERGYAGFRAEGFEPDEQIATVPDPLDGREASVRNRPTELTDLITASFVADAPGTVAAVMNSGSIRIDDVIPPGPVTQYDVIRILPFGGTVQEVELKGSLLAQALDKGPALAGSGGFLQTSGITGAPGAWQVAGQPIDPGAVYKVAMNDYLAAGKQNGLEFLGPQNPDFLSSTTHSDVRKALIAELSRKYPPN